jgi:hypothetical protein
MDGWREGPTSQSVRATRVDLRDQAKRGRDRRGLGAGSSRSGTRRTHAASTGVGSPITLAVGGSFRESPAGCRVRSLPLPQQKSLSEVFDIIICICNRWGNRGPAPTSIDPQPDKCVSSHERVRFTKRKGAPACAIRRQAPRPSIEQNTSLFVEIPDVRWLCGLGERYGIGPPF